MKHKINQKGNASVALVDPTVWVRPWDPCQSRIGCSEPHKQTTVYEDAPTGCVEALLTALAQGALGSITVCAVLPGGMFTTMSAIKTCKEIGTWGQNEGEISGDELRVGILRGSCWKTVLKWGCILGIAGFCRALQALVEEYM